jgi:hypothetical protein
MKKVDLSCEWILEKLAFTHFSEGNGVGWIETDSGMESMFVELALNTLGIKYSEDEYINEHNNEFYMQYKFKIKDIKDECPNLYKMMHEYDEINKMAYLRNRLVDTDYKNE